MVNTIDFFSKIDDFKKSDIVYIIGSGPNGLEHIPKIDCNQHVIVLNGACQYPIKFDHWFCFDHDVCKNTWFSHHFEKHFDKTVFSSKMLRLAKIESHLSFAKDPNLNRADSPDGLIQGVLRGGATIAGAAYQACIFAGYKSIVLVGIDMYGSNYFYNQTNNKPQLAQWKQLANFNVLLRIGKSRNINTTSLSKTELNIHS